MNLRTSAKIRELDLQLTAVNPGCILRSCERLREVQTTRCPWIPTLRAQSVFTPHKFRFPPLYIMKGFGFRFLIKPRNLTQQVPAINIYTALLVDEAFVGYEHSYLHGQFRRCECTAKPVMPASKSLELGFWDI